MTARKEIQGRIEIEQAYVDGEEIESQYNGQSEWVYRAEPMFDWRNLQYRIKPKPREMYVHIREDKPMVVYNSEFVSLEGEVVKFREVTDNEA